MSLKVAPHVSCVPFAPRIGLQALLVALKQHVQRRSAHSQSPSYLATNLVQGAPLAQGARCPASPPCGFCYANGLSRIVWVQHGVLRHPVRTGSCHNRTSANHASLARYGRPTASRGPRKRQATQTHSTLVQSPTPNAAPLYCRARDFQAPFRALRHERNETNEVFGPFVRFIRLFR